MMQPTHTKVTKRDAKVTNLRACLVSFVPSFVRFVVVSG
jgi:hypothetical protein